MRASGNHVALQEGPFNDEQEAAVEIAKRLKVAPHSLLREGKVQGSPDAASRSKVHKQVPKLHEMKGSRSKVPDSQASKFSYVTKRTLRGQMYWVGQPWWGKQKLFKNEDAAVAWVAKMRKTSVVKLRKGNKLHKFCTQVQKRLAAVLDIYGSGSEVPGDVEYLRAHAISSQKFFAMEPALEILDVQAKYGPFRDALMHCFQTSKLESEVPKSKVYQKLQEQHGLPRLCRALRLHFTLLEAMREVEGSDFSSWVTNCGRNVSHHSGLVPMLMRLKMIQIAAAGDRKCFHLSSVTGRRYVVQQDSRFAVLAKLCQVIKLADTLRETLYSVQGPRSCTAWCKTFHALRDAVHDHPCPGMMDTTSYLPLWTLRALMLRRMYSQSISRLRADHCSWQEFTGTFPDQKKMMTRIVAAKTVRAGGGLSCSQALKASTYKGPVELMAMFLCFCGAVEQVSTDFLLEHRTELKRARKEYKKTQGQNPVLMVLVDSIK